MLPARNLEGKRWTWRTRLLGPNLVELSAARRS